VTDRQYITCGCAQVLVDASHLLMPFTQSDHEARLGDDGGAEILDGRQDAERAFVRGLGPRCAVQAGKALWLIVSGADSTIVASARNELPKSGIRTSTVVPGIFFGSSKTVSYPFEHLMSTKSHLAAQKSEKCSTDDAYRVRHRFEDPVRGAH
jgi:hypothetical protein